MCEKSLPNSISQALLIVKGSFGENIVMSVVTLINWV